MGKTLEALHRLQAIERKLAELRRNREAKTRRLEYHQRQIRKADEKLQKNQLAIRERQKRFDALQLEVTSREESIDKHRQVLNRAKTNKEYAAILTAMNTEKADNAKLETGILQLMEEIQNVKDEVATVGAEKAKVLGEAAHAEEVLCTYNAESQQQRDDLQAERDTCAEQIPPAMLAMFNRVAEHLDGEAMAPITKLHPKRDEYACSGCNMKVTLDVVNALQTRDEIQPCKVCGRILYLETPETKRSRT
ncbi:MAG: C4-type zinc ribbon domain-containing protein [Phycisphaerae bacterium]